MQVGTTTKNKQNTSVSLFFYNTVEIIEFSTTFKENKKM